jgi:uncharacterized membrane protein YjjP (DUF1212 family)
VALTLKERSQFVLAFARVLFVSGQSTAHTVAAAQRLAGILDLRARLLVRWGELQLVAEDGDANFVCATEADPAGVDMTRVTSAMRVLDDLDAGRLTPAAAIERVSAIAQAPPGPTWLFALAAGSGAAALSVIFGVQHLPTAALIFVSAAAGGMLRRRLAPLSTNVFLQPFCAALLAGVIGALAVRYDLSSSLRLVAVCPCMVLVPGPHLLNGAMDLIEARIHLGATRLIYAGVVLVAIAVGLLVGLALLGVSLPVDPPGRTLPLWEDIIAAGVAVFAYGIFFNTPLHMLPSPIAVGMVAHALRWVALTVLGASAAIGAMVACVIVGLIITPVANRWRMPFAAIGFASVVSMMPGVYVFRMASGILEITSGTDASAALVSATVANGATAVMIILAMSVGLIVPHLVIERLSERATPAQSRRAKE